MFSFFCKKRPGYSIFAWAALTALVVSACLYFIVNVGYRWIPLFAVQLARQPDLLEYPKPGRCGECHQDIFAAWKKSRHSLAWTSQTYIQDSDNRSKQKCLSCHIPESVLPDARPEPRTTNRESGVYCVPCHVRDGVMQGPYELFSPPHPTRRNTRYSASSFCRSCHGKTYKEWKATEVKKTCQECHMPRSTKRLIQKFPRHLLHAKKQVGDHSFPTGKIRESDLQARAEWEGKHLVVSLLNKAIPHSVPTADSGDPRVYLTVSLYDESGEFLEKFKEILAPQQDTGLAYGKKAIFSYFIAKQTRRVEILLQYKPAWSKEKTTVRELRLTR